MIPFHVEAIALCIHCSVPAFTVHLVSSFQRLANERKRNMEAEILRERWEDLDITFYRRSREVER